MSAGWDWYQKLCLRNGLGIKKRVHIYGYILIEDDIFGYKKYSHFKMLATESEAKCQYWL